ncbi:MAG: sodium:proton antiporter, partial [Psychromonas sp.]|nr:sodium:proton antiporter [Psychromonas sp.]
MSKSVLSSIVMMLSLLVYPSLSFASSANALDLTDSFTGYFALFVFFIAYLLVMSEEILHLAKSKPVLVAAGIIWGTIAWVYAQHGLSEQAEQVFRHNLLEYAELLLFLLVAMTYINALEERRLFDGLRIWIVSKGYTLKCIFWFSGCLSFFISPVADNLTTALLMCAVVMKVGKGNNRFISIACVNIVVCANAGGAFSPFGDITTLMVWQKGIVQFEQFFALFIPSVVNALIPATIMSFCIKNGDPQVSTEKVVIKRGAFRILFLFLVTISLAVLSHSLLHMPPVLGMMTGLGLLQFFGYFLRCTLHHSLAKKRAQAKLDNDEVKMKYLGSVVPFDVFSRVAKAEWDTLLFFYGVVLCVGGLGFIGYLGVVSEIMYTQWDTTYANITVGVLSAIVDNIPVMFAVLNMNP